MKKTATITILLIGICSTLVFGQSSAQFSYNWLSDSTCASPNFGFIMSLFHPQLASDSLIQWSVDQPNSIRLSSNSSDAVLVSIDPNYAGIPTSFIVSLDVTDKSGTTVSSTQTIPLNIHYAPAVRITPAYYDTGCTPWGVEFSNESTSPHGTTLSTFAWDFGDGNTSSDENPSHVYQEAGNFDVILSVTDANGCTSNNQELFQATTIEVKTEGECQ